MLDDALRPLPSKHQKPSLTDSHKCQWGRKLALHSNFTASFSTSAGNKPVHPWGVQSHTHHWSKYLTLPNDKMRFLRKCDVFQQRKTWTEALQKNGEGRQHGGWAGRSVWKSLPSSNLPYAWTPSSTLRPSNRVSLSYYDNLLVYTALHSIKIEVLLKQSQKAKVKT